MFMTSLSNIFTNFLLRKTSLTTGWYVVTVDLWSGSYFVCDPFVLPPSLSNDGCNSVISGSLLPRRGANPSFGVDGLQKVAPNKLHRGQSVRGGSPV